MIILVRAISKCFKKYFENVKAYYKQANKHLLKMNVNKYDCKTIKDYP